MKVLIACEESQTVCKAFRAKGHEAFFCDLQECSGGHPEWHIQGDALKLISPDCTTFTTMDGCTHEHTGWDLLIAHPPCTYLSFAGNRYFNISKYGDRAIQRHRLREEAAEFFMRFANANCEKICIENPVGWMNAHYKKPAQTIHPYFFAENEQDEKNYAMKRTCLWLKGLPPLERTTSLPKPQPIFRDRRTGKPRYFCDAISGSKKDSKKLRSKTFPGIAEAMAEQWGGYQEKTL